MSFPQKPPVETPVIDLKTGFMTTSWVMYFTALSAKLNSSELNLSFVTPNLIWTDKNGHPHILATQT